MNRSYLAGPLVAGVLIAMTAFSLNRLRHTPSTPIDSSTDSQSDQQTNLVRLSPGKRAVAGIETQLAKRRSLTLTRTLPARLGYDENRHVAVRTPTAGVILSVNVSPGDQVSKGTLLATIRSPAVGEARNLLLKRKSELELAATNSDWQATVRSGVQQLVDAIQERKSVETIKQELGGSVLGSHRSDLLGRYNRLLLAEQLNGSIETILPSGAVSGKVAKQRNSDRNEALANLEATLEQAVFETTQSQRETAAKTRHAQQAVALARQRLANLTGAPETDHIAISEDGVALSALEIRSPIDGTIQQRFFTATERIEAADELFIVADTTTLWVNADMRAGDMDSITVEAGDSISVRPNVVFGKKGSNEQLQGTIQFIGREIDAATGTVPMVIAIENAHDRFRPGLFARVDVPVGRIDHAMAIPDSAIVDLDGTPSVFVQRGKDFHVTPVVAGAASDNLIEIKNGIDESDAIVVKGAFVLKSEFLLEAGE